METTQHISVKNPPGTGELQEPSLVLYADDDVDDRDLMQECFALFSHHKLLTFVNGQDLLYFIQQMEPCCNVGLIILDINMPLMSGVEALVQIRSDNRFQNIPAVLFSTGGSPADRAAAEALKTDIVIKSSSFQQMKNTIKTLLSYYQHQQVG